MRGAEFAQLQALVEVARQRSFRKAAKKIGVSPSAVSKTVRDLEIRLGVSLIIRTTRSVALSEAGAALIARVGPAFDDIGSAVQETKSSRGRPAGAVRINLPRIAAMLVFAPRLGEFAASFPDIALELVIDDDFVDVIERGCDAGVRIGNAVQRDMVSVPVSHASRNAIVGSPAYFAARPKPERPQDLSGHRCINYRWLKSGAVFRWPFERGGERIEMVVDGPLTVNDSDLVIEAACQGVGLASTLEECVAAHLAAGTLIRVLEDWCPAYDGFSLYYPARGRRSSALQAVERFFRCDAP